MKSLLKTYLTSIANTTKQGDAREESYYSAVETLFSNFPLEKDRKTMVTVLPKQTEAGNPDFRIWDGQNFIVGYIEAKAPGTNLDQVETSEQLERYLSTFPNVILTNFYEFRLYRDRKLLNMVTIGRYFTAQSLKTTPQPENILEFETLANQFFSFKLPKSFTAESLAIELAKRTRFLRDQVIAEELKESDQGFGDIYGYYQAFQKYLIPSLTPTQFADLYSQTLTYGLFAARTRANDDFTRKLAFDYIPHATGILRDVFRYISLGDLSRQLEVIIDDITAVLNAADINSILDQYYREGRGEDPIVHFYETFLNQYDPKTRERRGVYYTPEPVVKYIVKSVHHLLKTRFGLSDGLADPTVTVLDPAAGTLTFPAEAIRLAVKEFTEKYGEGGKQNFIRSQILKNFYALELMMAPYAIGHLKIAYLLESLGYTLQEDERFNLYLSNTLEMEEIAQMEIPIIRSLSEESRLAGKVKQEPILVIMGNPPYSGASANRNAWTEKLLKEDLDGAQSYYTVDEQPLGERNPKWLQDDYVKFLRFAQWKIHKAGMGIVAMITNHSYLDNNTFRGMRQSLLKTFDEIFILDLHGNSLKKEMAPDGGKDENVFDIKQGVAIVFFIKNKIKRDQKVYHKDKFGLRDVKYHWLERNYIDTVEYSSLSPTSPFYFFVTRKIDDIRHYQSWKKIDEIFPVNSVGIVTARDKLTIQMTEQEIWNTVLNFANLDPELARQAYALGKDARDWKISLAQGDLKKSGFTREKITRILYRPFDKRFTYYTGKSRGFICMPRQNVMRHMLENNICLVTVKRVKTSQDWCHCLIGDKLIESCYISNRTSEISYVFPLYLYPDLENINLFNQHKTEKSPNIQSHFYEKLSNGGYSNHPERIFNYIYGIIYSKVYQKKYFEYLKIDFPRIPFTKDEVLFNQLSQLGERLAQLHLLKSPELNQPTVKYQGQGEDHIITKPAYDHNQQRVFINKSHYFEGITPEVWAYQIGGYQVLDKYLKERKGSKMVDPRHYIRVATALEKTIEIQAEIDELYPEVEKDLIEF